MFPAPEIGDNDYQQSHYITQVVQRAKICIKGEQLSQIWMPTLVKSSRIYTGQYTFPILLLNDDNMLGEHK